MKKRLFTYILIFILIVLIIIYFNSNNIISKCVADSKHVNVDIKTMKERYTVIERKTIKYIVKNNLMNKLIEEPKFMVPSMINGTYCDINYSTYYKVPKNMNKNNEKIKIRVRNYYFFPGLFFEIKKPNLKIRTEIDHNYNIITIDEKTIEYSSLLNKLLKMLKNNELIVSSKSKYKRYSYYYNNNNNIRITLDTDIEYNDKLIPNINILEIKYPISYKNNNIIQKIKNKCNSIGLEENDISKSDLSKYSKY